MPKRTSKKQPTDINLIATSIVEKATVETALHKAAVILGRLGGLKGGKARAKKLSPTKRRQIAKKAATARWSARTEKK